MFSREQKKILKKIGFTSDQSGLINRYLSESENWDPHLINCRNFILECVNKHRPEQIAFLGSGWWLDIPFETLSEQCSKVIMVDVLHPMQIIHKAKKYKNIQLEQYDVTGGLIFEMYHMVNNFRTMRMKRSISEIQTSRFTDHIQADYYVSANMLDQMDSFIVDYLEAQKMFTEEELLAIRGRIHTDHLKTLPAGRSCLISDFQEMVTSKKGGMNVKNVIHADLPDAKKRKEWIWEFDHSGTYHPGKKTQFKIIALEL